MLIAAEALAFLGMVMLAAFWILDKDGNYEPWIVLIGLMSVTGSDLVRRLLSRKAAGPTASGSFPAPKPTSRSKPEELAEWILQNGTDKPLSQLLPTALQLAQVVKDHDFERWVRLELYGYNREGGRRDGEEIPTYREVTGRYYDQYGRMLCTGDSEIDGLINNPPMPFSVREFEELSKRTEGVSIRQEGAIDLIRNKLGADVYCFRFSAVEAAGVIDRVRNRLLERVGHILKQLQSKSSS